MVRNDKLTRMVKHSEIKPFQVKQPHVFTLCTDSLVNGDGRRVDAITNFLKVGFSSPCNS